MRINRISRALIPVLLIAATAIATQAAGAAPSAVTDTTLPAPQDRPYPGELRLAVDATDVERGIVHVHETLSGLGTGGIGDDPVLLYPEWLPGHHAPQGTIDRFAGLAIHANGVSIPWVRDPVNVFAFHLRLPPGTKSVDVDFDYLSPTSAKVGKPEISHELLLVEWNSVVLYPAGFYVEQIPVDASLKIPAAWKFGSALEPSSSDAGDLIFKRVSLETLVDSPVYAGKYAGRLTLDPGPHVPVVIDVFADRQELLAITPEHLTAYRTLVQQAYKLFGSHHYAHYDFLYSLSTQIEQNGLEHHQSSEDGGDPTSLVEWDKNSFSRSLLPHEFTHSWNGKFRRPADLWTPNYNVPMQDSLLWVYEGQTQYWGEVLTARSGLWTRQQAFDQLALTAAYYDIETGARWRPLQDTTNDPIINPRRPMSWRDWQRFEDYYAEGMLIWLDVDTLIRERSHGKRSLDDFAKAFFGINDGSITTVTYTFDDAVAALNAVEPYDWARFLRERLVTANRPAPLDGLQRGGYRLVYDSTPSEFERNRDEGRKRLNLLFSVGLELDNNGAVMSVIWDSPAFKAGLTEGAQLLAVNGMSYSGDLLKDAIREAVTDAKPIELIIKNSDRYQVVKLDYHTGLRYPHLERDPAKHGGTTSLEAIFAPKN